MHPVLKDTAGLGTFLWLIGYLASMAVYFTPLSGKMGWIITAVFAPFTILVAWWWFEKRERLPLQYYAGVRVAWTVIAVVPGYLFIVLLFKATTYYAPDVFLYYALVFLIPVGVGWYLNRAGPVARRYGVPYSCG